MNLKGYTFNTKDDFVYYIKHLLTGVSRNINSYENRLKELDEYVTEKNLVDRPQRVVSKNTYEKYREMLGFTSDKLLNLFGDQALFGCSYQNYRKAIKKKSKILNLNYVKFTQEQEANLNKITNDRDWANHVPVSLIHSKEEKAFNIKFDESTPIYLADFERYKGAWLVDLLQQNLASLELYKIFFDLLKEDYKELTGYACIIHYIDHGVRDIDDLIIPRISKEIQMKKIKTNEEVKEIYERERK